MSIQNHSRVPVRLFSPSVLEVNRVSYSLPGSVFLDAFRGKSFHLDFTHIFIRVRKFLRAPVDCANKMFEECTFLLGFQKLNNEETQMLSLLFTVGSCY